MNKAAQTGSSFLDTSATGLPVCVHCAFPYTAASSSQTISAVNIAEAGTNGATANVTFSAGNGDSLVSNANDHAINGLAGPQPGMFDFGLPFFFGRNVYVANRGKEHARRDGSLFGVLRGFPRFLIE